MREAIVGIVYSAIESQNMLLERPIDCSQKELTALFGQNGQLDSMALVSLIIDIEEKIESKMDITIILASDKALSSQRSPFATIRTLVDYITLSVSEQLHG